MSILVRRIHRVKWQQVLNNADKSDSSADAITNCLRTYNNDLSVWKIDGEEYLTDAILALITGSQQTRLSAMHYVLIDEATLLSQNLTLSETDGDTAIENLKKTHRDISNLTYSKLGVLKNIILEKLELEENTFFTRVQLKKLLKEAIESGKVQRASLNSELLKNENL